MQLFELFDEKEKYDEFHPHAWGYHLILDCRACDKSVVKSKERLTKFVEDLVKEVDMVSHGPLVIEHFPNRDPAKNGFSFVQLIETSSITGHFVDKTGDAYIDIFTCKEFSVDKALDYVKAQLKPISMKISYLTREA